MKVSFDYAMITEDGPVPYIRLDWFEAALENETITHKGNVYFVKTFNGIKDAEPGDIVLLFDGRLYVITHLDIFDTFVTRYEATYFRGVRI